VHAMTPIRQPNPNNATLPSLEHKGVDAGGIRKGFFSNTYDYQFDSGDSGFFEPIFFSWSRAFRHYSRGKLVGRSRDQLFTWGMTFDVHDAAGQLIGTVTKVSGSWFGSKTEYSILDQTGKKIGTSRKLGGWYPKFTVTDMADQVVATMELQQTFFTEKWEVEIGANNTIDKRILLAIPVRKSAADAARAARSDSGGSSSRALD
jgi:hypothetical protein